MAYRSNKFVLECHSPVSGFTSWLDSLSMKTSKHSQLPLPSDTEQQTRSVFNIENLYLAVGDKVEHVLEELPVDNLLVCRQPMEDALLLALITIFQYLEDLSDDQASEAVRMRLDWKYALHLPIDNLEFDPTHLCQFRQQLYRYSYAQEALLQLFDYLIPIKLLSRLKRSFEVQDMLISICRSSHLFKLINAMRQSLEALASRQPELLRSIVLPHWYSRYAIGRQSLSYGAHSTHLNTLSYALGSDICHLLRSVDAENDRSITEIPEIEHLQNVWVQQYQIMEDGFVWQPAACSLCWWSPVHWCKDDDPLALTNVMPTSRMNTGR